MSNLTVSRAEELATLINENETQIKSLGQSMIDRAISSGGHLIEIKEILPHGEFMPFCKKNVAVQKTQIASYMKAASEQARLPEYFEEEGGIDKGLIGFIKFLSLEKPTGDSPNFRSSGNMPDEEVDDEPEDEADYWEADEDEPPEADPKPYKPKVYDMPVDERLQGCAFGVVQAAFQFYVANQETGGRLTHDQVVRAIHAELVTTSSPHSNKAKVYREAHEQIEQFLAVFVEAFAEISPAISLTKASSI